MLKHVGTNLKTLPLRHHGGVALAKLRVCFGGSERYNQSIGDGITSKYAGLGWGHRHPSTWLMAYKAGAISAHNRSPIVFTVSDLPASQGRALESTVTYSFTVPASAGAAVAAASANVSYAFTVSSLLVTAPLEASGSASYTFSVSGDATADAYMQSSVSYTYSTSLTTGAIGNMVSTPIDTSLTAVAISEAVWSAVASNNNTAGSMGEKLNDAGSAGNPWTEVIESGFTAEEVLRIIASVVAGKVSGAGTGTEIFKGLDGVTDRVVSTVDTNGNRSVVVVDGT